VAGRDFVHIILWNGKTFRVLNELDDNNRQALWIEPDTSLPAERVVRMLNQLKEIRGVPAMIRVDNGSELVSIKLDLWCREYGVTQASIQTGDPTHFRFI
jgi:putative transposase